MGVTVFDMQVPDRSRILPIIFAAKQCASRANGLYLPITHFSFLLITYRVETVEKQVSGKGILEMQVSSSLRIMLVWSRNFLLSVQFLAKKKRPMVF